MDRANTSCILLTDIDFKFYVVSLFGEMSKFPPSNRRLFTKVFFFFSPSPLFRCFSNNIEIYQYLDVFIGV